MARVVRRRWIGALSGPSRRDSRSCEYEAYVPDPLVGRVFTMDGDVAANLTNAEAAIARLDFEATSLVDTEALARILLRAESVPRLGSRGWRSVLAVSCAQKLP